MERVLESHVSCASRWNKSRSPNRTRNDPSSCRRGQAPGTERPRPASPSRALTHSRLFSVVSRHRQNPLARSNPQFRFSKSYVVRRRTSSSSSSFSALRLLVVGVGSPRRRRPLAPFLVLAMVRSVVVRSADGAATYTRSRACHTLIRRNPREGLSAQAARSRDYASDRRDSPRILVRVLERVSRRLVCTRLSRVSHAS